MNDKPELELIEIVPTITEHEKTMQEYEQMLIRLNAQLATFLKKKKH